jgi:DNA sulfur modification protein DndD
MSLKLKKLTLNDFGPYMGTQTIALDVSESSPVVLIHGENTLGKTQLFSAMRWCLYGTFAPQQSARDSLSELSKRLNRRAQRESDSSTFSVSLSFDVDGQPHSVTRAAVLPKRAGDKAEISADMRIGATVIPSANIDAEVGRLLHPQISEFFLFDGELLRSFLERLASERDRSFIRESIEQVLGIPALQLAKEDVNVLVRDAMQRQAKTVKDASEQQKVNEQLRVLADETSTLSNDRSDLTSALAQAQEESERVRAELRQVEGLTADVRDQERLEALLNEGERVIESLRAELRELVANGWFAAASRVLESRYLEVQAENNTAHQQLEHVRSLETQLAVLEDRAKGGTCPTCHQELPPPDEATESEIERVKTDLAKLQTEGGGVALDLARERRVRSLLDAMTPSRYREKQDRLNEHLMLQYERKQSLDAISDRLAGHKAADIRQLGVRSQELDRTIESLKDALGKNAKRGSELATQQQKLAQRLKKLPGADPAVILESKVLGFLESILAGTIDQFRDRVRHEVQDCATAMFLQLIRDPDEYQGLQIGANYEVALIAKDGRPRETSEGGKQLLALSLIGALKRSAVRGGPVVLDSPLGRLDKEHRRNVLQNWIPSLGTQAVLLVQSGELTQAEAHESLGSLIGREYLISRPDRDPENAQIREA